MEHADQKGVIEAPCERKMINVCLNDVRVLKAARRREGRFDRHAEVYADHVARSPLGDQTRMPTLAAAAFEHDLVFEETGLDGRNPAQKLLRVPLVLLRKVLPLPAEALSSRRLIR